MKSTIWFGHGLFIYSVLLANFVNADQVGIQDYSLPLTAPRINEVVLSKSTFGDAEKIFGAAQFYGNRDNAKSPLMICYSSMRRGRKTKLFLRSEIFGGGEFITEFIITDQEGKSSAVCTPTSIDIEALKPLEGRLSLGMTKQEVIKAIGNPVIHNLDNWDEEDLPRPVHGNTWFYLTTWPAPFSGDDVDAMQSMFPNARNYSGHGYYAWTRVRLKFRGSRLAAIDISHDISN